MTFPSSAKINCILISAVLMLGTSACRPKATSEIVDEGAITKIAFGSCFNPRENQSEIFEGILKHQPDAFIFLGDNIYGDTFDMEVLKKKYAELEAVEGFQKLRDATTMLATWDDHDYGVNDGGNTYEMRDESQQIFVDFFKDPEDSPRRERPGVYASYSFGPAGQSVQVLVLDTRYFRDMLPKAKGERKENTVGWYEPTDDTSMTLLGEAQWQWLEEQLQVPADVRIIASSIQVLAYEKGMENWGHVPHEQTRLFELLKKHRADHTFAISGDVHFTEISKKDVGGYPFYDFTSSGMSHPRKIWSKRINNFRIGESKAVMNAGLIEIDWESKSIELAAIDTKGEKLFSEIVQLSDLVFED
jgi:alkaline phosphatase D